MTYDTIFSRSFSKHEQKKLGWGAFIVVLIVALCLCTVFKPYIDVVPVLSLRLSMGFGLKLRMTSDETSKRQTLIYVKPQEVKPICEVWGGGRSDVCEIEGDTRIHGNSSTIFIASTHHANTSTSSNNSWSIRPYARKVDKIAMQTVTNFTIKVTTLLLPKCTKNHTLPAVLFSTAGYTGNHFHDFTDVIIPLYLTSRDFHGKVHFLVSNKNPWWIKRYQPILSQLSNFEVFDIDKDNEVRCFTRLIIGLKTHKEFDIDPLVPPFHSMKDFRNFLRSTYKLKRSTVIKQHESPKTRPRLLIISRKKTRAFSNEGEIADMARKLGFDVVLTEAFNVSRFSEVVNSCDVMMGVHGAGLSNMVFLPENAVVIQIVPWGGMEGLARTDFGLPSKSMNLRYMEYKISERESSLIEQYPMDHQVFRDPYSIRRKGWGPFRAVYLDKQNVKIDVNRFRPTLEEAIKLLNV